MIVVVYLKNAPHRLAGQLSQYLIQIDHSLFVSRVTAKVTEFITILILKNVGDGEAFLITSDRSSLGVSIRVIRQNTILPFDGNLTDFLST